MQCSSLVDIVRTGRYTLSVGDVVARTSALSTDTYIISSATSELPVFVLLFFCSVVLSSSSVVLISVRVTLGVSQASTIFIAHSHLPKWLTMVCLTRPTANSWIRIPETLETWNTRNTMNTRANMTLLPTKTLARSAPSGIAPCRGGRFPYSRTSLFLANASRHCGISTNELFSIHVSMLTK